MSKYTIYSTKQDWDNLYERIYKINKISTKYNLDIKKAKKSSSFDMWDFIVQSVEEKLLNKY
tara:strand:- start:4119 stop:4304 length:186 start_codon:yes stop_codon:yes gene_type:complete